MRAAATAFIMVCMKNLQTIQDKAVDMTLLNIGNEAETAVNSILGFVQLFKSGAFHQMDQKEHFY
mgnify:CR=1 FL=1